MALTLTLLDGFYAAARLSHDAPIPAWASGPFITITRTPRELSIIAPEMRVPGNVHAERGLRVFEFKGPFAFTDVGILASVAGPLAEAGVSILAISTFDTDYVLVKERDRPKAQEALAARGVILR